MILLWHGVLVRVCENYFNLNLFILCLSFVGMKSIVEKLRFPNLMVFDKKVDVVGTWCYSKTNNIVDHRNVHQIFILYKLAFSVHENLLKITVTHFYL